MNKKSILKTAVDRTVRKRDIANGKLVLRKRAKSSEILPLGNSSKQRVNIFLDSSVVAHFKEKAGGRGYQTLINEALKQSIQSESIESTIRHAIQQELAAYKV
jgi:uncharacterized protein (DUF4415 family)